MTADVGCPSCRALLDPTPEDVTPGARPRSARPNDIGLCGKCGAWLMVAPDGGLRLMTNAEWLALSTLKRVALTLLRAQRMEAHP